MNILLNLFIMIPFYTRRKQIDYEIDKVRINKNDIHIS